VLALFVNNEESLKESVRERILFLVSGIVFMTLVINGSTMHLLLRWLARGRAMTSVVAARKTVTMHAVQTVYSESRRRLRALSYHPHYMGKLLLTRLVIICVQTLFQIMNH
jgi:hypothetical protein